MDFLNHIRYPSKNDWTAIMDEFPTARQLTILQNLSIRESCIKDFGDFLTKPTDFSNWKKRLLNKLGKLRFSYVLSIYYSKGLPDDNWINRHADGRTDFFPDFEKDDKYKKFLFDYSTESFYYHYFSALDILAQLLNLFYECNIPEGRVYFSKIDSKIPDQYLSKAIKDFNGRIESARESRNGLTHKFPFNEIDTRNKEIDNVVYGGVCEYRPTKKTIEEINNAITEMEKLLRIIESRMIDIT